MLRRLVGGVRKVVVPRLDLLLPRFWRQIVMEIGGGGDVLVAMEAALLPDE
jgi:hypothetical protein